MRFAHPLVADAALAEAAREDVSAAHRALAGCARTIEERAVHLARAADGPDAAIASSLDDAVASARARGAPAIAADLAELAASVTPPTDPEAHARRLLDAADAAFVAGDTQRAREGYESGATGDHALRHRALWRLGVVLDETVGPEEAIGPLRQALDTTDDVLAAAAHRSIAQLLLYTGDTRAALDHAAAAVAAAERSASTVELAYANGVLAFARHTCGDGDWEQALEQALEHERASPPPDLDLAPSAVAADLYRQSLQLDRAGAAYEDMLELAAEQQDARIEIWATYGLTQIALLSGRLDDARRLADEHLDLAEQTGLMRLPALRCIAQHRVLAGETEEAHRILATLATESEERGELLNLRATLVIQGHLALSLGDPAAAAEALRRARAIAEQQNVSLDLLVLPLVDEIEALTLAGEADEATKLAALLESARPSWAAPLAARAAGLAAAARGDVHGSAAQLRAAAGAELPLPLEHARSFLALGRVLRRAKLRGEARHALAEACRRFREIGAALWAERAAEELSRVGGRTPEGDALTSTERRIAALVAEGRSNKEAAQTLFLSVKTIEVTLTRVYRKLGVRGRAELAARYDELLKP